MSDSVNLMVPALGERSDGAPDDAFTPQSSVRELFGFKPKPVDTDRLQDEMVRIESQLAEILKAAPASADSGFNLDEVQVSLAISGEGSIGIVTAGVEASITLGFTRGRR